MTSLVTYRPAAFVVLLAIFIWVTTSLATPAHAQTPVQPPLTINVTSDSAPGWLPTQQQRDLARKTATDFLTAMDEGRARNAYEFLGEDLRRDLPFADFAKDLSEFNTLAGRVKDRRMTVVTWTKDSPAAPRPGVYVAIDLVSKFAKIDRHCGYLVLYQQPMDGSFQVTRREDNYFPNSVARGHSKAEVDEIWSRLSANCPGYGATPPAPEPLEETEGDSVGYPTVAAAMADLRKRSDVKMSMQNDWTIFEETASMTLWSFPPSGHPAYPSAVKRQLVNEGGGTSLKMGVHCEAAKAPCDDLVRSFQQLNAEMIKSLK